MTVVDATKIARAIGVTKTTEPAPADEPARARELSEPKGRTPARATEATEPNGIAPARATPEPKSKTTTPARAIHHTEPTVVPPARADYLTTIRLLGRTLDDLERLRIMHGNRVDAARRDGHEVLWVEAVNHHLKAVEHEATLELKRAWRKHPLAKWAKDIPGAGEVLMARLIAEIGDPADRPNPGKLLAYCGHGDPARAGAIPKGATQEELFKRGNPHAKKAVWKLAYQFMRTVGTQASARTEPISATPALNETAATTIDDAKSTARPSSRRSPYRDLYEQRKTATGGKLHEYACKRCGPAGKPAVAGSPWSDAHRHADALRIVGKRFLIDLWVADCARAGQAGNDDHSSSARAGQGAPDPQMMRARAGQDTSEIHVRYARAGHQASAAQSTNARAGQRRHDTQMRAARAGRNTDEAHASNARAGQPADDTQTPSARAGGKETT